MVKILWHYAVFVGGQYYTPACWVSDDRVSTPRLNHGMTLLRGDVDCTDCMCMMGMPV